MLPTLTAVLNALTNPKSCCTRLENSTLVYKNGRPLVTCSNRAIEAVVDWVDRRYLLTIPLRRADMLHLETLEIESQGHTRGPLIESQVLCEELTLYDNRGGAGKFSVILQEISGCITLDEAVRRYRASDLRNAVEQMVHRLDNLGFLHNNLKSSNILICENGRARPIRYWHAEWRDYVTNNIEQPLALIAQYDTPECDISRERLPQFQESTSSPQYGWRCGVKLVSRHNRYGFIDIDGCLIAPYIYTWASEFCEGRAIVAKNNKMGAIDVRGAKILSVSYNHLEFDEQTGSFIGTRGKYRYLLNYEGKKIQRFDLSEEISLS